MNPAVLVACIFSGILFSFTFIVLLCWAVGITLTVMNVQMSEPPVKDSLNEICEKCGSSDTKKELGYVTQVAYSYFTTCRSCGNVQNKWYDTAPNTFSDSGKKPVKIKPTRPKAKRRSA
jgi:hypothetical protein